MQITNMDKILAVNLDVSIWSGARKLTKADLEATDVSFPPEKLASLGSKKIFDPATLAPLNSLKKQVYRDLDQIGVRFIKGWAVSEDKLREVAAILQNGKQAFEDLVVDFLANYDSKLQDWILDNEEWAWLIESAALTSDDVRKRMSFTFQIFRAGPPVTCEDDTLAHLNAGLEQEAAGLGDTLLEEIAQIARLAWKESFKGKTKVRVKAMGPIRRIYDKLNCLSFLDACANPIMNMISSITDIMPTTGIIEGSSLVTLQGLVKILMDPESMREHGELVNSGAMSNGALFALGSSAPLSGFLASVDDEDEDETVDPVPAPAPDAVETVEAESVEAETTEDAIMEESFNAPPMPASNQPQLGGWFV